MLVAIENYIAQHNLLPEGTRVVLGLSGGPDSVFLLHFLAQLYTKTAITLIAAHLDHEWRPSSKADALFCKKFAQKLNVPFVSTTISALKLSIKPQGSQEAVGRILRRYFLESVLKEYNADSIALAHHANDQQETFFIRLIRGTTISGLASMRPKHGCYIRPLLETYKSDIINYLDKHQIAYRTDETNISERFLRNRIRLQVIPALQACDKRFDKNFLSTINHIQQAEEFLEQETRTIFNTISSRQDAAQWLSVTALLQLHPYIQKRVLLYWLCIEQVEFTPTDAFFNEIIRFLEKPHSGSHRLGASWAITKQKAKAAIKKLFKISQDK